MDDQSHVFQLLFQEQIDEYKQSLASIDDLFDQKKEQPIIITESIDYLFEKDEFLLEAKIEKNASSSSSPSTTISGFLVEEEEPLPTKEVQQETNRTSFSCNGTSELPRHIQDVRERVKQELGVTTNLHLTDEERKLLADEGAELPEDLPLTRAEERILKKVRRKIRNKRSAMESRRRKKEYISAVEEKYGSSKDENDELKKRVKFLENQNHNLMAQLQKLQRSVMSISKNGHACALSVVLFSLFVFCYPGGTGPFTLDDDIIDIPYGTFKSRKILEVETSGAEFDYMEIKLDNETLPTLDTPNITSTPESSSDKGVSSNDETIYESAEIVSGRHHSLMPESPEEYMKTISRQREI